MNNINIPSQRQLRVGESVRQIISNCFVKNTIPDKILIDVSITVSMVRMTKDLKSAYVYVMPLGGYDIEEIITSLNNNKSYFQKEIGKKIKAKNTPKVFFYIDDTFKEAERINKLLTKNNLKENLNKYDSK